MAPKKEKAELKAEPGLESPPKPKPVNRKGKTVEQIYQKKTQLEHILLRPDTYVGSVEPQQDLMWVFDESSQRMKQKNLSYVPGLYKIFDEILVNAADNMVRDPVGMTTLKVDIDAEEGSIKVFNNGQGVPIQIHKEHKVYVPELVFGHLLTSDNYDDTEAKVTGGRNGYGAKLTNIFSKKFIIETGDDACASKYRQVFQNNMGKKGDAKISTHTGKPYTSVQFWPDFPKFGMEKFDTDTVALMKRRVYDIAGSSDKRLKVYLNGELLPVKTFTDYAELYLPAGTKTASERVGRWEVVVACSEGQFTQVSFVNSINTIKGGTHVDHVTNQLVERVLLKLGSKNKGGMQIKPYHVKAHLAVFVSSLIENPAFSSQTKETLTTKAGKFGSKFTPSETLLKKLSALGVTEAVLTWAKVKQEVDMKRKLGAGNTRSSRISVPKLEDANWAGGKRSDECTLILTEGDSAKSLAVAGLSVIGRDKYGVFPLRGKLVNIREAATQAVTKNAEVSNLLKILGLDPRKEHSSPAGLRYGSVMFMTDQDLDGSHIKGLLMNLFHFWWPDLCKCKGFLREFATPIVKVTKGTFKESFFTLKEYNLWKAAHNDGKGYKCKYYKGLGTSTSAEAKEYFRNMQKHQSEYRWAGDQDGQAIDLAFNKKRADDRKVWINNASDDFIDHNRESVSYSNFINLELVQFSKYDVIRSIPSLVDGLKPTQRKVLFCAFKRNLRNDVKVAQFVGYVSEQSAYHHGEVSLENTIVNMAQTFVGSNNVNYLVPSGQFGTRLQGGKDNASSRYIYTRLEPVTRVLFHPDDDKVLNYLEDEGQKIEPKWYVPVIPTVLLNGADGIGTGWSTQVLNYNPRDIVTNLRRFLAGEDMQELHPWYKGYKGSITPNDKGGYDVVGVATKTNATTVEITELPIRKWTQDYKEFLQDLLPENQKTNGDEKDKNPFNKFTIDDFKEYHTENTVHFEVTLSAQMMDVAETIGFDEAFRLKTTRKIENMHLFDKNGKIQRYSTARDILEEFALLRLEMYAARKKFLVGRLRVDREIVSEKARFISMVVDGKLKISNRRKVELVAEMKHVHGFKTLDQIHSASKHKQDDEPEPEEASETGAKTGYEYLLGMNLWCLTHERVEELKKQLAEKTAELETLEKTSEPDMWLADLAAVEKAIDERQAQDDDDEAKAAKLVQKNRTAGAVATKKAKKRVRRKKKGGDSSSENVHSSDDDAPFSDDDFVPVRKAPKKKAATPVKSTDPSAPKGLSPAQMKAGDGLVTSSNTAMNGLLGRLLARQEVRTTERATEDLQAAKQESEKEKEKVEKAEKAAAKKRAEPKEAAPKKRARKKGGDSDSESSKKRRGKKRRRKGSDSESDSDSDADDDDDEYREKPSKTKVKEEPPPRVSTRPQRAAAKKVVKYTFSDSDEGFSSDGSAESYRAE